MDRNYIDKKIELLFCRNKTVWDKITLRNNAIENSLLSDIEQLDLKLELLIAGRQYLDDLQENDKRFDDRLEKIDSKIDRWSPSMPSVSSIPETTIDIDETDEDRTLTEESLSPRRRDFSDSESTG